MTDEELLERTLAARRAAHDAPLNPYREDADGHRWVHVQSHAWSSAANDWMTLAEEVNRRGLSQPTPNWDGDSNRSSKKDRFD